MSEVVGRKTQVNPFFAAFAARVHAAGVVDQDMYLIDFAQNDLSTFFYLSHQRKVHGDQHNFFFFGKRLDELLCFWDISYRQKYAIKLRKQREEGFPSDAGGTSCEN